VATYVNLLSNLLIDIPHQRPYSWFTIGGIELATFQTWRYINLFIVLAMYAFETRYEGGDGEYLVEHLKGE